MKVKKIQTENLELLCNISTHWIQVPQISYVD